jgi:hypothetical protein
MILAQSGWSNQPEIILVKQYWWMIQDDEQKNRITFSPGVNI